MEIERIQELADRAQDERERQAILNAGEIIADTFTRMLHGASDFILNGGVGEPEEHDAAREALRVLHDYGERYGISFPAPENNGVVNQYVIHYGSEVIRGSRKD